MLLIFDTVELKQHLLGHSCLNFHLTKQHSILTILNSAQGSNLMQYIVPTNTL